MNTPHPTPRPLRFGAFVCFALSLLAPALFVPASLAASAPTDRQLFSITETVIKPDKVREYERLITEEVNPALKKAGYTARNVFTRATFGDNYTYISSTPIENYARYDQPNPVTASMGEDASRALTAKLAACQVSSRTFAIRAMPTISHLTAAEMGLAVIYVRELTPGRKADWVKFQQDVYLPAVKSSDSPGYLHYETVFGGSANEVTTLSLIKNYAELDGPNAVSRKVGAEGYQKLISQMPPGLVVRTDRWIIRLRKELSIIPDSVTPKTASK
jgi:hypothetical protein